MRTYFRKFLYNFFNFFLCIYINLLICIIFITFLYSFNFIIYSFRKIFN